MRMLFFILIININAKELKGQNDLLKNNPSITPISSVNWKEASIHIPFFDSCLKKKNILVLSEIDHGDGDSKEAQCAILKGLIDSGKINSLFLESSWINLDEITKILNRDGEKGIPKTIEYLRDIELRYWVDNGFWDFICKKIIEQKLKLVGFDIDGISSKAIDPLYSEAMELHDVTVFCDKNRTESKRIGLEYKNYDSWGLNSRYDKDSYNAQKKFISLILDYYKSTGELLKVKKWQTILDCFYWMYKRSEILEGNKFSNIIETELQFSQFHSIRDSLMAEVFYQYYSENKNNYIVAIMSAYHAMKFPEAIEGAKDCCFDTNIKTLNEILVKKYNLNLFTVGFIRAFGSYGVNYANGQNMRYNKVAKPVHGSIEKELATLPYDYCVLDLNFLAGRSFLTNLEFSRYLKSEWAKNFSALFFIKKMHPLVFKNLFN